MYHHTVLLHLDKGFDPTTEAAFKELAREVLAELEGVLAYGLRVNEATSRDRYGHVLFSAFANRTAFQDYDRSELHGRIKALLAPHLVSLVVADGEVTRG